MGAEVRASERLFYPSDLAVLFKKKTAFGIRKGEKFSLEAARPPLVVNLSEFSLDAVHRDARTALERQFKSR